MSSLVQKTSLGQGSLWFAFASSISKGLSFVTQIVLGWFLLPEEFGLYAIALSLAAWGLAFRNGGTDQYLIQQGKRFTDLAPGILTFSLIFNGLACIFLTGIGLIASEYYQSSELLMMMLLIGIAQLLTSPAAIMRAQLSIGQQYKAFSMVTLLSDSSRQISSMLLAMAGFGVFAFVIPMAIEPLISAICVFLIVRHVPKPSSVSMSWVIRVFNDCKWLMLSNFAMALTLSGIYMVLGFVMEMEQLGFLFFALQLVTAISVPITNGLQQIFFAHLSNGVVRENRLSLATQSVSMLFMLMLVAAMGLYLFAGPLVEFLWQGKWDEAIPLIKICALTLPVLAVSHLVFAIMSAEAQWKIRCFLILASAILDMIAVALVAVSEWGTLIHIASVLVFTRTLAAVVGVFAMFRLYKIGSPDAMAFSIKVFMWVLLCFPMISLVEEALLSWLSLCLAALAVVIAAQAYRQFNLLRRSEEVVA